MRTSMRSVVVGCMLIVVASGCQSEKPNPTEQSAAENAGQISGNIGGVAILDLDKIAKRFGCDRQMGTSLQQREASLNQQLASIKSSYEKQIAERRQAFGDTPSEEQAKLLADIQRQANARLLKVRQQAKNNLNQHGSLLIQGFRREIKPIARQVARERGLSIIVTRNDSVIFDYDTTVDITEGVIAELLAMQPKQTPSNVPETARTADRSAQPAR